MPTARPSQAAVERESALPSPIVADVALVHVDELARAMGYSGATNSFREWCAAMRITPVPGRVGWYDPRLVRRRLDEAQGLLAANAISPERALSLVEQRRARRAQS